MKTKIKNHLRKIIENNTLDKETIGIVNSTNLVAIISLIMMLIGASMNYVTIISNNCRMPVISDFTFTTPTHFYFDKNSPIAKEIKMPSLIDKYPFNGSYYSLGDIFIYSGFFILVSLVIYLVFLNTLYNIRKFKSNNKPDHRITIPYQ